MLDLVRRACPTAIRFAAAFACAACSAGGHPSGSVGEGTLAGDTSTSDPVSDSIATAWESSDTEATSAGSSSTASADATTDTLGTESTAITEPTTDTPSTSDESSSTGDMPTPVNLFANPSLEEWANASDPNTNPDLWDNCSTGGTAVDAVPDSCAGIPDVMVGTRYARAFSGEGIEQTVETIPGATYRITLDYTAVGDCFGGVADARWEVLVNEDQILTTENTPDVGWESTDVIFDADQPTTTICFRKFLVGQGGIDNLVVVQVP
jgi:hypothetical protein